MSGLTIPYYSHLLDAATATVGSLLIYSGVLGTFVDPLRRKRISSPFVVMFFSSSSALVD